MICQIVIYVIEAKVGQGDKNCGEWRFPFNIGWLGMTHLKGDT